MLPLNASAKVEAVSRRNCRIHHETNLEHVVLRMSGNVIAIAQSPEDATRDEFARVTPT